MSAPKMTEKDVRNMFLSETTSFIKAVGGVEGLCLRKQSRPGGSASYSWILRYDSGRKICSLGTASLNGNSGSGINLREARSGADAEINGQALPREKQLIKLPQTRASGHHAPPAPCAPRAP